MNGWIVGIDGGGTKTAYSAFNLCTEERRETRSESISPADHGMEVFRDRIQQALAEIGIDCGDVVSVVAGVPCFGENDLLDKKVVEVTGILFPKAMVRCENDCFAGFAGAFGLGEGINIVCGTGAVAYGEDSHGNKARSNGWHPHYSDEGSGVWLGRECYSLFFKELDGRVKETGVRRVFLRELGIKSEKQAIAFWKEKLSDSRKEVARLQLLLGMAAREGDKEAQKRYEMAARELAVSVYAVYQRLMCMKRIRVSYSGGVFLNQELLLVPFRMEVKKLIPDAEIVPPLYSPEEGALLAAAKQIDHDIGTKER